MGDSRTLTKKFYNHEFLQSRPAGLQVIISNFDPHSWLVYHEVFSIPHIIYTDFDTLFFSQRTIVRLLHGPQTRAIFSPHGDTPNGKHFSNTIHYLTVLTVWLSQWFEITLGLALFCPTLLSLSSIYTPVFLVFSVYLWTILDTHTHTHTQHLTVIPTSCHVHTALSRIKLAHHTHRPTHHDRLKLLIPLFLSARLNSHVLL